MIPGCFHMVARQPLKETDEWLTVDQLVDATGLSKSAILTAIKKGEYPWVFPNVLRAGRAIRLNRKAFSAKQT